jgi:hypothetical protein
MRESDQCGFLQQGWKSDKEDKEDKEDREEKAYS